MRLALTLGFGLVACAPEPAASEGPTQAPDPVAVRVESAPAPHRAPPAAAQAPPASSTMSIARAYGLDRVDTACRNFDIHITNADRTRMLDIVVDAARLGLKAGTHPLAVGGTSAAAQLEVFEFDRPLTGERDCTDLESDNNPGVATRWRATAGELSVRFKHDPQDGRDNSIDLELRDIRFEDGAGNARVVHGAFANVGMGWIPG